MVLHDDGWYAPAPFIKSLRFLPLVHFEVRDALVETYFGLYAVHCEHKECLKLGNRMNIETKVNGITTARQILFDDAKCINLFENEHEHYTAMQRKTENR